MAKEKINESAIDSLKPQSHPENDPKSKVETLKSMVGAANCMTNKELTKWFTSMIDLYPAVGEKLNYSADKNRQTNNMKSGGKNPLPPMPMVKLKEDVDALFEDDDQITEEAKEKILTLFEAAVSVRAEIVEAELIEAYEEALQEEIEGFIAETEKTLSAYLDHAIDRWISENEVAIVNTLRLENAEDFIDSLKGLFTESFIDVPDERLDVVQEMADHVDAVEDQLAEALSKIASLQEDARNKEATDVFKTVSEGLTMVDAEKFASLCESVEFTDSEAYGKKLGLIREKHFKAPAKVRNDGVETLNEEHPAPEIVDNTSYDPGVAALLQHFNGLRR